MKMVLPVDSWDHGDSVRNRSLAKPWGISNPNSPVPPPNFMVCPLMSYVGPRTDILLNKLSSRGTLTPRLESQVLLCITLVKSRSQPTKVRDYMQAIGLKHSVAFSCA